ncbi:MAG TPA: CPBP family intramembrane glutamic endopeptidase [Chthoniobacterales bacterium]|nr:CPBP family intramembrane glutamic endopeptidase [Chthoniobacterales bacterium]
MNPRTTNTSDPSRRALAWVAVIGSTLPEVFWKESGHRVSFSFIAIETVILLAAAVAVCASPRIRGLSRFLFAIAALNFAWSFIAPALAQTSFVRELSDNANWGARFFIARALTVSGAVLVSLTLIGSGLTRRELYLNRGNLAAPAQPIGFLGLRQPVPWTWFGPGLLLAFALTLAPFLYFTLHPNFAASGLILRFFPWMIAVSALNAASEEYQFRNVLLAHLRNVFSAPEAVLLTAVYFGLGHYYGQPSGPLGVLMAGFAGWIWARSMIETRGFFWAFTTHMVQDIIIFAFLAISATNPGAL